MRLDTDISSIKIAFRRIPAGATHSLSPCEIAKKNYYASVFLFFFFHLSVALMLLVFPDSVKTACNYFDYYRNDKLAFRYPMYHYYFPHYSNNGIILFLL